MIASLYAVKVPQEGNSRTTYNVGTISGGTSVNTIAQDATMLYEYRSNNRVCLDKMKTMFESVVQAYRNMGIEVEVELVGDRPCKGEVDPVKHQQLLELAYDSIRRVTGKEPILNVNGGSTDCNIPLSVGIPAICMGIVCYSGAHTRQEILQLSSLPAGSEKCMDFLCHFFE